MWRLELRKKDVGDGLIFHAYAVHISGKVEKEGRYKELLNAQFAGQDLVNCLNDYDKKAKFHKGTDKLCGRKVGLAHKAPEKIVTWSKIKKLLEKEFEVPVDGIEIAGWILDEKFLKGKKVKLRVKENQEK